jgi:hypothetical protein
VFTTKCAPDRNVLAGWFLAITVMKPSSSWLNLDVVAGPQMGVIRELHQARPRLLRRQSALAVHRCAAPRRAAPGGEPASQQCSWRCRPG